MNTPRSVVTRLQLLSALVRDGGASGSDAYDNLKSIMGVHSDGIIADLVTLAHIRTLATSAHDPGGAASPVCVGDVGIASLPTSSALPATNVRPTGEIASPHVATPTEPAPSHCELPGGIGVDRPCREFGFSTGFEGVPQ